MNDQRFGTRVIGELGLEEIHKQFPRSPRALEKNPHPCESRIGCKH